MFIPLHEKFKDCDVKWFVCCVPSCITGKSPPGLALPDMHSSTTVPIAVNAKTFNRTVLTI